MNSNPAKSKAMWSNTNEKFTYLTQAGLMGNNIMLNSAQMGHLECANWAIKLDQNGVIPLWV